MSDNIKIPYHKMRNILVLCEAAKLIELDQKSGDWIILPKLVDMTMEKINEDLTPIENGED